MNRVIPHDLWAMSLSSSASSTKLVPYLHRLKDLLRTSDTG